MSAHRRFTLIELLVVVAVIAILAAMLLPVLAGARLRARETACAATLRQWGMTLYMYGDENDDRLPRHDFGDTGRNVSDVALELHPALGGAGLDWRLWACPLVYPGWREAYATEAEAATALIPPLWNYFAKSKYGWWVPRRSGNTAYPSAFDDPNGYPTRLNDPRDSRPVVADYISAPLGTFDLRLAGGGHRPSGGFIVSTNLLFIDGHVERRPQSEILFRYNGNYNAFY